MQFILIESDNSDDEDEFKENPKQEEIPKSTNSRETKEEVTGDGPFNYPIMSIPHKALFPFYFVKIALYERPENFQARLLLGITRLVIWLKSTLLLKNKCFGTTIYITQCCQTNETQQ